MQDHLYPYQKAVIEKVRQAFIDGHKSVLLYSPCGGGKTEMALSFLDATSKKNKRSAMVLDRIVLIDQTSKRMDKYKMPHGIMQSGSWRWRPNELIQVCSAQTLEAKGSFPDSSLLIVDECHSQRSDTTAMIKNNPHVRVIGLSGSPFTKGLASTYSVVISSITISELVDGGYLCPLRVFIAKEIDMTGAKKVAGEWSQKEATDRGIKVTGDIVSEWVKKTHEIYGGPRKTVVFCAGVAHGEDLSRKFADAGYNFVSISYKDDAEYKQDVIDDFSQPDTAIHGLIATDILTKGFDNAAIEIMVSARPFSKSFSSHIQQLGRGMRAHPSKTFCTLLDHSGNFLRFRDDWEKLYAEGVSELVEGSEKPKKEPTDNEKEAAKCPKCNVVWSGGDTCLNCGHVRTKRNDVVAIPGEMVEIGSSKRKEEKFSAEYKSNFYAQLLGDCQIRGHKPGKAYYGYIEKFGVGPSMAKPKPIHPGPEVLGWIKSQQIRKAKAASK